MLKSNTQRIKGGDLELKEKVVSINRVVKTTKGGRAFSFSALVVVGNENGVVGQGLGKAKEVQEAITKGIEDAKKNLNKVPVMHGTIPHEQLSKRRCSKGIDKTCGTWYRCNCRRQYACSIGKCRYYRCACKILGSANPHNVVKATVKALATLREPIAVAKTRNISLKKVFNG